MYPILFTFGRFSLYTHGVFAVAGIAIGSVLIYFLAKKEHLKVDFLFDNIVYAVLFGIIGARTTYVVMYSSELKSWREAFYLWQGGLVSYGGFIAGALATVILLKSQREPLIKWLDVIAIAFPLGLFFGRIGDVLAGEYFGITNSGSGYFNGLVPITLYEALFCLMIFLAIIVFYKLSNSQAGNGYFLTMSVGLYGGGRFIIDFWRDENDLLLGLSTGQITSLIIFVLSLLMLIRQIRSAKERTA